MTITIDIKDYEMNFVFMNICSRLIFGVHCQINYIFYYILFILKSKTTLTLGQKIYMKILFSDEVREKMKSRYLSNPDYNFEKVNRASLACGPMVKWAIAQVIVTFFIFILFFIV